ncbi:uncharacterized protein LOC143294159 [Babylonia areolata]|uniref:uncharacterized protein LOC143294159 n=1 Tax=Babylonia areolata TaxID=304850 RepID=UPI003FCF00FB
MFAWLSIVGALWTAVLLSPSFSFPTTTTTTTTTSGSQSTTKTILLNDTSVNGNDTKANGSSSVSSSLLPLSSSSSSPNTTTTVTTPPSCPGGAMTGDESHDDICPVRYQAKKLLDKYAKNNKGTFDPGMTETLRDLLTAPVTCRGHLYTALAYFHSLLTRLQQFYEGRGGSSNRPYIRSLRYLNNAIEILQQSLIEDCVSDCSLLTPNATLPTAVTSVSFGNTDDAHEWGSLLAQLLLQQLDSVVGDGGAGLCVRRRRQSAKGQRRGKGKGQGRGKGKGKGRRGGRRIQEELERGIADASDLEDSNVDKAKAGKKNNKAISNELPGDDEKDAPSFPTANRPANRDDDDEKVADKKQARRRKNRRRGRKTKKGKGRKSRQEKRRQRRLQRMMNKRRRGGRRNRNNKASQ